MGCTSSFQQPKSNHSKSPVLHHNYGIISPQEQQMLIEDELRKSIAKDNLPSTNDCYRKKGALKSLLSSFDENGNLSLYNHSGDVHAEVITEDDRSLADASSASGNRNPVLEDIIETIQENTNIEQTITETQNITNKSENACTTDVKGLVNGVINAALEEYQRDIMRQFEHSES